MTVRVDTGVDVVDIDRFGLSLRRTPSLRERLFTEAEREAAGHSVASLAARFAAKEAAMKALGVGLGGVRFHDISVAKEASGAPRLELSGMAVELARKRGWLSHSLSLSHSKMVAVAVVVAQARELARG